MWRRTRDDKLEIAAQVLSHSQDCEMPRESSGGCAKACRVESDWAQPPEDSLGNPHKSYICLSAHRKYLHSFDPSSCQVLEIYISLEAENLPLFESPNTPAKFEKMSERAQKHWFYKFKNNHTCVWNLSKHGYQYTIYIQSLLRLKEKHMPAANSLDSAV